MLKAFGVAYGTFIDNDSTSMRQCLTLASDFIDTKNILQCFVYRVSLLTNAVNNGNNGQIVQQPIFEAETLQLVCHSVD